MLHQSSHQTFYQIIFLLVIAFTLTACDETTSVQNDTPKTTLKDSEQVAGDSKKKSTVLVTFKGQNYPLVVFGRCTVSPPHYQFWAIQPEHQNTTGQGTRLQLIGGPEQTVIKFYQDNKQLLSKVLTGDQAVHYTGQKMHIKVSEEPMIDIKVDCQQ